MSIFDPVAAGSVRTGSATRATTCAAARAGLIALSMIACGAAAQARPADRSVSDALTGPTATTASRSALPEGSMVVARRGGKILRGAATGVAVGAGRAMARERNRNRAEDDADAADAPHEPAVESPPAPARPPVAEVAQPKVEPTAASLAAAPTKGHDCVAGCNANARGAVAAMPQAAQVANRTVAAPAAPAASFQCFAGCDSPAQRMPLAAAAQSSTADGTSSSVTVLRGASRRKVYGVTN
jgi:hypothetical protein